jgi:maleylpyruvate isomerase
MMKLYSYWRSSAAYRVRIALNLKKIDYFVESKHLVSGEQSEPEYLAANPQGLVPALEHEGEVFVQSLAIIEYLDSVVPSPRLFPQNSVARAHVSAMAQAVACEIHPLNNLRVMKYLKLELAQDGTAVSAWMAHWMQTGFEALESWAAVHSSANRYLFADAISIADLCLVPQIYNARRFEVDLSGFPALVAIDAHVQSLPAVVAASPECQSDAP